MDIDIRLFRLQNPERVVLEMYSVYCFNCLVKIIYYKSSLLYQLTFYRFSSTVKNKKT